MEYDRLADWLMEVGGPIIRYKTALELLNNRGQDELESLREEALACDEAQRWIGLLNNRNPLHSSKDIAFENILSKLGIYGLTVDIPEVAQKVTPYLDLYRGKLNSMKMILLSCLAFVGYTDKIVEAIVREMVDQKFAVANKQVFDFLKSDEEKSSYPKIWREKPIYRDELVDQIPGVYDLLAFAFFRHQYPDLGEKLEAIAAYILDRRFQRYPATIYIPAPDRIYCHSGISPKLPCYPTRGSEEGFAVDKYSRPRLLLYLFMMAHFSCMFESSWYRRIMAHLSEFRTDRGTYRFPSQYLNEKPNSYFLYAGSHMGLGENRRRRLWREIESTFWMLWLHRQEKRAGISGHGR